MRTGLAGRAAGLAAAFAGLTLGLLTAVVPPRAAVAAQKDEKKDAYPRPPGEPNAKRDLKKTDLLGAAACKKCHSENDPTKTEEYDQTKGYEFIRLWENKVWEKHDLHATAFRSLLTEETAKGTKYAPNKTAERMEQKLRRFKNDDKYTVATDTACLACHASTRDTAKKDPPSQWKAGKLTGLSFSEDGSFSGLEGVGCEMCHGHGRQYQTIHQESREDGSNAPAVKVVDWRLFPTAVKKEWGLTNLRDSATAVQTCASCHIGNVAEGRFVTHDMYAAGHPPLPPLDLMAYTREQPRHWGFASDMPYITNLAGKQPDAAYKLFHYRTGESYTARRFAEATLATLGSTAALGGQLADEAKKKADGLDFAAFDCYACHHDLKYPSDRQQRGYVGRPGRPLYRPAAFALARIVLEHAGGMKGGDALKGAAAELDKLELELADAFTAKTYGDADKVRAATDKLAKWSDEVRNKLEPVRYTADEVAKLLAAVTAAGADAKKPVGDPEVAQLVTWAVETLYLDLYKPADKKEPPAELAAMTKKLDGSIVARLRPKTVFYYEQGIDAPFVGQTNDKDSVDSRLKERMEVFNNFRGAPFRTALGGLKLPAPK